MTDTSDLWWKTAVFYNLNVRTFLDLDGDGIGDFAGLAQRLDYLEDLGVTCLWLAPFYPSPRQDNGYDISDYFGIDPRLGHLGDFVEMVRTAHDRGMRVIVDLVVNHTSDQHPWFVEARQDPHSRYRDYYQWRDEPPADQRANLFPDTEDGIWFHDEVAGQYYKHTFYRHQPDLNIGNPVVREEIAKVLGLWLQLGVDGFRVDAVPYLIEADDHAEHDYLRAIRGYVGRRSGDGVLLGEVNLPYAQQVPFFGADDGDELTMQFDFVGNQQLWLSLARQDATPLRDALATRPLLAPTNQWANFVRNHDELSLDQLDDAEREEVFAAFAPEPSMRIHGRGITRRTASMLADDPRRARMVQSLLFALPGAPVLYYGQEIGMGDHGSLPGRRAVRTPMQWSRDADAGFSRAAPAEHELPLVEGDFSPAAVNVSDQQRDQASMLQLVRRLTSAYRQSPEIGWGALALLEQPCPAVLVHTVGAESGRLVALHNFGPEPVTVPLQLPDAGTCTRVVDLLSTTTHQPDDDGHLEVGLDGYGFVWLRVLRQDDRRLG